MFIIKHCYTDVLLYHNLDTMIPIPFTQANNTWIHQISVNTVHDDIPHIFTLQMQYMMDGQL